MAIFKCKMCGGTIEFEQGATVGVCDSCGTKQTLPRLDDDRRVNLYDRANHFRRNNEFDKAAGIYEQILTEDTDDAEAYWSLVLCRYGIEYVEDPATHKRVPTVNRAQFTSIFDDDNYKSAIRYADVFQRGLYEEEAKTINDIQKGILAISQKEEPFDVFICYKETDANGRRTPDSVLANDLYHQLTQEGFKVFFSRITLENKLGTAYEPYIFAALNSAKVMVVLGTKPEHFNAVWVKNEWSRYLALVKTSGGKKILIPAYKDMDPYDLPEEFSHLQAQDMSKLGFMQDLIRGIKKIAKADEPKETVRETVVVGGGNANVAPLLERAFLFLEDGKWQDADIYCEKVLDIDPRNAEAYLGKLMADLRVKTRKQLADCAEPFDDRENYGKVLRFGDEKLETEMRGYIAHINERNENARLTVIYNGAVGAMNAANSESAFKAAAETFKTIHGFKDADALVEQCLDKAKAQEEADRIEAERRAEKRRIAAEKAAKKLKKIIAIAAPIVVACIAFLIVLTTVILPKQKLKKAMELIDSGNYEEAYALLEELGNSDGASNKYDRAVALINSGDYEEAYALLAEIGNNDAIASSKYDRAVALINSGDYEEAYALLAEIGNNDAIASSKYDRAVALINSGDYEEAYALLAEIGNNDAIASSKYDRAVSLISSGNYDAAIILLQNLNYKDSETQLKKCYIGKYGEETYNLINSIKVGDTYKFGSYEQNNKTSDGKEEIEWIVLEKDGTSLLLISKYALELQYNSTFGATWESCSLRKWLNGTFISNAFNTVEQNKIQSTMVTADKNPAYSTSPGNNTTDKVFLLSNSEVVKYFSSSEARICAPSEYAIAQGADTSSNACRWWLRSPGRSSDSAAVVYSPGRVYDSAVISDDIAVRPALWINLQI